ncbi:MAG: tetratricopeptide repeat protein [Methylococcales bacterium]|nr:tetratricopeptide repeat protein [Methylococcales bacterium]MBT7444639.1 tetratricopeptide repeat protein [Methylococcales bacterium]
MDCWSRLGIAQTQDKRAIKKAYAVALKKCHPEDDPEGFQQLREAYDEALQLLSAAPSFDVIPQTAVQEDVVPDSAVDPDASLAELFLHEMTELYLDYPRRIDVNEWHALFQSEVLWRLEVKSQLHFQVFHFVAHHSYLPSDVWQVLEAQFSWNTNSLSLYETFPEEMVEFVLEEMNLSVWAPNYQLVFPQPLPEGKKYDDYLNVRAEYLEQMSSQIFDEEEHFVSELRVFSVIDLDVFLVQVQRAKQNNNLVLVNTLYHQIVECFPNTIDGYVGLANLALDKGDWSGAAKYFQSALTISPEHLVSIRGAARCALSLNNLSKSIELLNLAVVLCDYDVESRLLLLRANTDLIVHYSGLDSLDSAQLLQLAQSQYDTAQYQNCVAGIQRWVNSCENVNAFYLLGLACEKLETTDEADQAYFQGISLADQQGDKALQLQLHFARGRLFANQEKYQFAIEQLELALAIDEKNHEVLHHLADAFRMQDNNKRCIELSDQAIALTQKHWIYYSTRGLAYFDLGLVSDTNYYLAIEDFTRVLSSEPGFVRTWLLKGHCEFNLKQYEAALLCYQEAYEYDPEVARICQGLVRCYFQLNEYKAALDAIEKYAQCDDSAVEMVYYYKAELLRLQGLHPQAKKLYCEGAKTVKEVILWCGASECLLLDDEWHEAIYYLDGIVRYDENDVVSHLHLAYAYIATQQWSEAQKAILAYFKHIQPKDTDDMAYFYQGLLQYYFQDYTTAAASLNRALNRQNLAVIRSFLSLTYYELGQVDKAIQLAEEAALLAPRNPDFLVRLKGMRKKLSPGMFSRLFSKRTAPFSISKWPTTEVLPHHEFKYRYFPELM